MSACVLCQVVRLYNVVDIVVMSDDIVNVPCLYVW